MFPASMLKKENQSPLDNRDIAKSIIEFSNIFQEDVPQHFIAAKTNILIILLCFTVYSIYGLFSDYLDTILIAVLSGVAYRQLRDRFIGAFKRNPNYPEEHKKSVLVIMVQTVLFFLLPWIRNQSKRPFSELDFTTSSLWRCFVFTHNPVIRVAQAYLFIRIIAGLFGERLHKLLTFERETHWKIRGFLSGLFAVITAITAIVVIVTVAVVLTIEIGRASSLATTSIEAAYHCEFSPHLNSTAIPCAEKISANLSIYLPKIHNQTEYQLCVHSINETEMEYLGLDLLDYEENICAFYQQVKSISPNIIQRVTIKETGAVLASFFGVIAKVFNFILDTGFSLSTFAAIFIVTVSYFQFTTQHVYIFGESKAKLVDSITNIISATIFIALEHCALGVVLFEIFRFSEINTILSIFLSVTAFIPLVKPSVLIMLIAPLKVWMTGYYLTPVVCCCLYVHYSWRIYEKYYSTVSLHIVIINLSVVFGIYQYGVTGIFYGPLLITLFQCVYAELFRRH